MKNYKSISILFISNCLLILNLFFFYNTPTTEIYTLSLHDALPIFKHESSNLTWRGRFFDGVVRALERHHQRRDRKSTRLNSSHVRISYAVFCLKKKNHGKHYGQRIHIE